jgi:choline dehydrogenase
LIFVHGDRSGYDAWQAAGAKGWNDDELLPFFKRSERAVGSDPDYRDLNGPVHVRLPSTTDPLWEACFKAAAKAAHSHNEDSNAAHAGSSNLTGTWF